MWLDNVLDYLTLRCMCLADSDDRSAHCYARVNAWIARL